jgi:NADPH:quinone reductase-like Zn-dependent oxidoreductase
MEFRMKAILYRRYGSPDVLEYEEIQKPIPEGDAVLVKIRAASVNPLDCAELKGVPYVFRKMFGLRTPTAAEPGRPGVDLAGVVEAVGAKVTHFRPGDNVFGMCIKNPKAEGVQAWVHRDGSYAEYACTPESGLALKPESVTFEQAAATPIAALTALQGLRNKGGVQPGQEVLIHGAAGGVGSFAVQIAKWLGAKVTGVTNTKNLDLVRTLGAERMIDYTQRDFTEGTRRYDVIFDCYANHPLSAIRRVLTPKGIYVGVGAPVKQGGIGILMGLLRMQVLSRVTSQEFVTFLARPNAEDLNTLRELLASGAVKPMIDRCFELSKTADAIRCLEEGHSQGKVVITVG